MAAIIQPSIYWSCYADDEMHIICLSAHTALPVHQQSLAWPLAYLTSLTMPVPASQSHVKLCSFSIATISTLRPRVGFVSIYNHR